MGILRFSIQLYLVFQLFIFPSRAAQVVRYIDDTYGDPITGVRPVYDPSSPAGNRWSQGNLTLGTTLDIKVGEYTFLYFEQ